MNIGEAIVAMRLGRYVRRPMWEPKVAVACIPPGKRMKEFLVIRCRDGEFMPWTPLSWDLLADDYEVLL